MRKLELILQRTVLVLLIALLAVYVGDSISVRMRSASNKPGNPIDTIQLNPLYAIPQKSGKNDYVFGDPQNETCVHSLFPHYGYTPCWYVKRNAAKIILIDDCFTCRKIPPRQRIRFGPFSRNTGNPVTCHIANPSYPPSRKVRKM